MRRANRKHEQEVLGKHTPKILLLPIKVKGIILTESTPLPFTCRSPALTPRGSDRQIWPMEQQVRRWLPVANACNSNTRWMGQHPIKPYHKAPLPVKQYLNKPLKKSSARLPAKASPLQCSTHLCGRGQKAFHLLSRT